MSRGCAKRLQPAWLGVRCTPCSTWRSARLAAARLLARPCKLQLLAARRPLQGKVFAATVNRGGGKEGLADRLGGQAGHARYRCTVCMLTAPSIKNMQVGARRAAWLARPAHPFCRVSVVQRGAPSRSSAAERRRSLGHGTPQRFALRPRAAADPPRHASPSVQAADALCAIRPSRRRTLSPSTPRWRGTSPRCRTCTR